MSAKVRRGAAFSALLLVLGIASAQDFWPSLPVEGAPLAKSGPYKVLQEGAFGLPGHIVIRPANLDEFPSRDALPVMVWVNGGCDADSGRYLEFLTTIASHGFLLIATTQVGDTRDPYIVGGPTLDGVTAPIRAALDWAESETARDGSPLNGKVATDRMAVMGLSCGGGLAVVVGSDPRVDTVGIISSDAWGPIRAHSVQRTTHIDRLHGPVLLINGGERDVAMAGSAESFDAINNVPVFYGARHNAGHMSTFPHPGGGEFANVASSWLKWILKGDTSARAVFAGPHCELCSNPNWETRSKALETVQEK